MEQWKPRLPAAKAVSLKLHSAESVTQWLFPPEKPCPQPLAPSYLQGNCLREALNKCRKQNRLRGWRPLRGGGTPFGPSTCPEGTASRAGGFALHQTCLILLAFAALLAGCTTPPAQTPDQRLQSQAAKDARQVHHDVKQAGVEAHHALVAARRETRDIVAGAREGWREGGAKDGPIVGSGSGSGGHARLDINRASASELAELPGVHASTARRIVAGQPYTSTGDLVKRGLVKPDEYARIRERIATR